MDAVTPKGAQTADTHSHLVRPDSMEWQKTRFPGCEAKTLLFDRKTGLMTALMRFAPGAALPDHEHVNIEQTYVLEGSLVDKEGPAQGIECKAGEFIWREQGSRHVAWCPQGGLMLAIFQVPNKFFDPIPASSTQPARIGTKRGGTPERADPLNGGHCLGIPAVSITRVQREISEAIMPRMSPGEPLRTSFPMAWSLSLMSGISSTARNSRLSFSTTG